MTKKVDGRVKVTAKMANGMTKMVEKGKPLQVIAEKYGVTPYAVKYNTNASFKEAEQLRKRVG